MLLGQHRDTRRHTYLESRSSTNASDAQESDDNFWVDQVRFTFSIIIR